MQIGSGLADPVHIWAMTNSKRLKGISLIWTMATMIVLCVMCAMGVDWGRVQVAKTELRRAADSAARAGAANLGGDPSIVRLP